MSHQSELISTDINAYLAQHERKELLRFEAIKRRGFTLAGVALNWVEIHDDPCMNNAKNLSRWLDQPVIVTGRFEDNTNAPGWMQLCPALAALADRLASSSHVLMLQDGR